MHFTPCECQILASKRRVMVNTLQPNLQVFEMWKKTGAFWDSCCVTLFGWLRFCGSHSPFVSLPLFGSPNSPPNGSLGMFRCAFTPPQTKWTTVSAETNSDLFKWTKQTRCQVNTKASLSMKFGFCGLVEALLYPFEHYASLLSSICLQHSTFRKKKDKDS